MKSGTPNFSEVEIGRKIWGGAKLFFFKKIKISIYTKIHEFFLQTYTIDVGEHDFNFFFNFLLILKAKKANVPPYNP